MISYLNECELKSGRHTRQRTLKENYLFLCQCELCRQQVNDPDETTEEEMSEDEVEEQVEGEARV